jgi:SAM-dependent methyltransferase
VSHDAATLAFYRREAEAYAARARKEKNSIALTAFLKRLQPGAHILDLGCGGGQDALAMMARDFRVTAQDGCPELAAQAERLLGKPVRVALFERLEDVEAFDAIWANASLLHVPRAGLPDVLARIHRALKHSGLFFASFKTGEAEGRDELGRYYNYLSASQIRAHLPPPAWILLGEAEGRGAGYDGVEKDWLAVTAQKSGPLANAKIAG